MELEQIEMASLIPQRPPFMMVDKILSCDDTDAVTELMVRQDNILLDDSKLSPAGIVEGRTISCWTTRNSRLQVSWRIWHSRVLPEWVV